MGLRDQRWASSEGRSRTREPGHRVDRSADRRARSDRVAHRLRGYGTAGAAGPLVTTPSSRTRSSTPSSTDRPAAAERRACDPRRPRARPGQPHRRAHRLQRRASCCRPPSTSRSGSRYLPTDDRRVELTRLDDGERDGFDLGRAAPRDRHWLDYVAGTAWALAEAGLPVDGLRGVIASTLPDRTPACRPRPRSSWPRPGRCSTSRDGPASTPDPRPDLPARRERLRRRPVRADGPVRVVVRRGRARRCCSIAGRSSGARSRCPTASLVVCHTGLAAPSRRRPSTTSDGASARRPSRSSPATTRRSRSLRDVTPGAATAAGTGWTRSPLGARAHIVTENERVVATVAALEAGDLAAVGRPVRGEPRRRCATGFEVSSPELDAMVEIAIGGPRRRRRADDRREASVAARSTSSGPTRSTRCEVAVESDTRPERASSRGSSRCWPPMEWAGSPDARRSENVGRRAASQPDLSIESVMSRACPVAPASRGERASDRRGRRRVHSRSAGSAPDSSRW